MGVQLAEHGLCVDHAEHEAHFDGPDGPWCPGYPVKSSCPNCDDRKCMSCIFREVHDACADDCPFCCPRMGGSDDSTASRSADLDLLEDMLSNLTDDAPLVALRAIRAAHGL